jgi:GMP synthase-like glutamine amidotransferase
MDPRMKPILVLQQVPHENLASLESHFQRAGLPWQYVELFRTIPARLDMAQAAGLVVLGGPMNVDEVQRFPFLAREVEWIREAVEAEVPLLGICLGSQLLAKAMGAKVYANAVKEIGWYEIELEPAAADDPLFADSSARQIVFQWHGDTFELPPGAVHLAPSLPLRTRRLGLAVPHRDDSGHDRRLAPRAGQSPRIGRAGLHRSASDRRRDAPADAGHASVRRPCASPIRLALPLTGAAGRRPGRTPRMPFAAVTSRAEGALHLW